MLWTARYITMLSPIFRLHLVLKLTTCYQKECIVYSARFVGGGGGGCGTPHWCLSNPQVFIDPHWLSNKYIKIYIADPPLWFYHKSSTD